MTKLNLKLVMMLLGVIALTTVFNACSDDKDDDNNISKTNIVGKWTLVKTMVNDKEELPDSDCPTKKDYLELLANGTVKNVWYNEECKEKIETDEVWKLEGKTFTLTETDEKDTYVSVFTIQKLNAKSMVLLYVKSLKNGKIEEEDEKEKDAKVTIAKSQ